jgi:hypothetical protein
MNIPTPLEALFLTPWTYEAYFRRGRWLVRRIRRDERFGRPGIYQVEYWEGDRWVPLLDPSSASTYATEAEAESMAAMLALGDIM